VYRGVWRCIAVYRYKRGTLKSAKTDLKHIIFTSTGSQTPISIPLAS
jgi:hypothetical protein